METNWNQLIERYLQNELSAEGRAAFEQEIRVNAALREELEMHQLIQSAAKRASQRTMVQQAGKSYFRNVRIKQITWGVVVTAVAATGLVYWSQHRQADPPEKPKQELTEILQQKDEPIIPEDTLAAGANQLADNSAPQHTKDGTVVHLEQAKSKVSFTQSKGKTGFRELATNGFAPLLKTIPITFREDSVKLEIKNPVSVPVSTSKEREPQELIVDETYTERTWQMDYDSVGRFNDLYCGYALVMHNAKIGFVNPEGKIFIPLMYDEIIVTSNIQSSKDKHKKKRKKKILYIPKRSGSEVQYCDEKVDKRPASDSVR